MKKSAVATVFLILLVALPVSAGAADWESVKEKARALGDETVELTKESWDSTEDWRKSASEDAAELAGQAKEKSTSWLEQGQKKLDELLGNDAVDKP